MNEILIAVFSAIIAAYPGYLAGRRVTASRRWYIALFWGSLTVMVGVMAWALIMGRPDFAAAALGVAFGFINGLRHGFSPVFGPLLHPSADDATDEA